MNFVQAGMLAALGALAVPIIVHLMFRRQARPVDLGTLQFLKIVLRDNARKRRLKRYALLALRLMVVALIALVFARPYLLANEPIDGRRLVVVLVDRSASMGLLGGQTPLARATQALQSIAARAGSGTQMEVAAFDRVVTPFSSVEDAISALSQASPSETDYGTAMAWARDVCTRSKAAKKELHILTDLQRSGLDRGEAARVPEGVEVTLTDLGRAFPKNVGVTALVASPEAPRPRGPVAVTATLRNASSMPAGKVTVGLHLRSEGNEPIDLEQAVDLEGDSTATVEFKLPEIEEGLWTGHAEVFSGDDLRFDDRRYMAIPVSRPARIMVVDGAPGQSPYDSASYFLVAALRLAAEGETSPIAPFDPRTITADALGSNLPEPGKTAAVVLANAGGLTNSDARGLAEYVAGGGGLVVFTGDRMTAEGASSLVQAGLGVGRVAGPESAVDRPWRLGSWDEAHPTLAPFADPEFGDLRRPAFATITRIEPEPSAKVVARFRDGSPALIEKAVGKGRVLWFASACDRSWGDWPRGRMYLPMVHQMVAYVAGLGEGGPVRLEAASASNAPGAMLDGQRVLVVNPDPSETETARCTPKEFADRFGFKPAGPKAEIASAGSKPQDDRLRGDEIWPWLALGLVGLLMIEGFLANRTAA